MTSKTIIIGLVAIAFVAGSIMTGTMAEAKPNTDGDGDGQMEGIIHELTDLLNHATFGLEAIQNAITSVQSDITMIKSDVTDIKIETDKIPMIKDDVEDIKAETADIGAIKTQTDKIPMIKSDVEDIKTETDKIQMLKDDIADIKSQLANIPEPLTKFTHFTLGMTAFDAATPGGTTTFRFVQFTSDGSMIMEVCKRSGANGDNPNDPDAGEGWVYLRHIEQDIEFLMLEDETPECRTMGSVAGERIVVNLVADAGFADEAKIGVDITIRTAPSTVIVQTNL